ncbi:tRNA (guanosine(37)-N1)-methyltransferase TrmD [Candidatus Curtissbacteria bacterium RIFCSPLOWO2_12_FULL_41_16]|nr:MAG: tRNA (guanosine(37)-N1)-methyltransferase TrmD [Candidatus Curtissbacteria bacterium RIFCSPLOWO2_12_FULL_41_16]
MIFHVLTLFPEIFEGVFSSSILKRAIQKNLLKINIINIRDFAQNSHKTVDDKPYGGGRGMILKVDVVERALESISASAEHTILLAPSGKKYDQKKASELSAKNSVALTCGHYEGVDARVEHFVDEVISLGDFVLTGGEIAAMAIIDSVARLVHGVIKKESLLSESFSPATSLLEYPHFTRPEEFRGLKVPKVLLSGNHAKIAKWRQEQAIKRTQKLRPDLILK